MADGAPRPLRSGRRPLLALLLLLVVACGGEEGSDRPQPLSVWAHAGQQAERAVLEDQVERWNAAHPEAPVELTLLPERDYVGQIQAAAVAGRLPDVLELDGPYVASFAWQGRLGPLEGVLPEAVVVDLLPSIREQGRYGGTLHAVGVFDSGLGLYGRRGHLEAAGVRIPAGPDDAWTGAELDSALAALAARDDDGQVLDLKLNYPGEWLTYAFAPLLWSAGAGLINRETGQATGVLDGPAAVAAMARVQRWFETERVDPNLDDAAFVEGRVPLSWVGHWEYPRYREAHGDDLVLLPLPDLGDGSKTGQGSWTWTLPAGDDRPESAGRFVEYLLAPAEVLRMTKANGAVPGRQSALEASDHYGPDGPLRLFATQLLEGHAVPRPRTPAYPVITASFQEAFLAIRNGADPAIALGRAAAAIDRDLALNEGYPAPGDQGAP